MGAIFGIVGEGSLAEVQSDGSGGEPPGPVPAGLEPGARSLLRPGGAPALRGRRLPHDGRLARSQRRDRLSRAVRPGGRGGPRQRFGVPSPWRSVAALHRYRSRSTRSATRACTIPCSAAGSRSPANTSRSSPSPTFRSSPTAPPSSTISPPSTRSAGARSSRAPAPCRAGTCSSCGASAIAVSTYWKPGTDVVDRSDQEHVTVVRDALLETVHRQVHTYEQVGITLGGGVDAAIVLGAIRRVAPDVRDLVVHDRRRAGRLGGGRRPPDRRAVRDRAPRVPVRSVDDSHRAAAAGLAHRGLRRARRGDAADARAAARRRAHQGGLRRATAPTCCSAACRGIGSSASPSGCRCSARRCRSCFSSRSAAWCPATLLGRALQTAVYGKTPPQALRVPGASAARGVFWRPEVNEFIRATIQRMHSHNYLEPHHELIGAAFHSPFLDPDMIATSLTVPGWLKSGWRRQKWVLREAAADLLPASIRHRKKAIQRLDVHGAMGEVLSDLAGDWLVDSALERHRLLTGDAAPADPDRPHPRPGEPGGGPPALVRAVARVLGASLSSRPDEAPSPPSRCRCAPSADAPQRALRLGATVARTLPLARSPPSFTTTSTT